MSNFNLYGMSFAILMTVMALASPAHSQATRTWVSGVGDDANPCSRTAPCKTFAGAISMTAPQGEINCLDAGGFGAVTITKSISIICQTGTAGVLVSGTNGIVVNAGANDKVLLEGLDIEGLNTGISGITMVGAGRLIVRNTAIRNFASFGINLAGASATPAPRILAQNVLITGNAGGGFNVQNTGVAYNAEIINSLIDTNSVFGIQVAGPSALILTASVVTGSPSSIIVSGGGSVISYGNNVLRNAGAPTQTLPLQ
jgi:hypothetical protein